MSGPGAGPGPDNSAVSRIAHEWQASMAGAGGGGGAVPPQLPPASGQEVPESPSQVEEVPGGSVPLVFEGIKVTTFQEVVEQVKRNMNALGALKNEITNAGVVFKKKSKDIETTDKSTHTLASGVNDMWRMVQDHGNAIVDLEGKIDTIKSIAAQDNETTMDMVDEVDKRVSNLAKERTAGSAVGSQVDTPNPTTLQRNISALVDRVAKCEKRAADAEKSARKAKNDVTGFVDESRPTEDAVKRMINRAVGDLNSPLEAIRRRISELEDQLEASRKRENDLEDQLIQTTRAATQAKNRAEVIEEMFNTTEKSWEKVRDEADDVLREARKAIPKQVRYNTSTIRPRPPPQVPADGHWSDPERPNSPPLERIGNAEDEESVNPGSSASHVSETPEPGSFRHKVGPFPGAVVGTGTMAVDDRHRPGSIAPSGTQFTRATTTPGVAREAAGPLELVGSGIAEFFKFADSRKLKGEDNYLDWLDDITAALGAVGYKMEKQHLESDEMRLAIFIRRTLQENIERRVRQYSTAREVLKVLARQYDRDHGRGASKAHDDLKKLKLSLWKSQDYPIDFYRLRKVIDRASGMYINPGQYGAILLDAAQVAEIAPAELRDIRRSWNKVEKPTEDQLAQLFDDIESICEEERSVARLKGREPRSKGQTVAAATTESGGRGARGRGKKGTGTEKGTEKSGAKGALKGDGTKKKWVAGCFHCGSPDHLVVSCPSRKAKLERGEPAPNRYYIQDNKLVRRPESTDLNGNGSSKDPKSAAAAAAAAAVISDDEVVARVEPAPYMQFYNESLYFVSRSPAARPAPPHIPVSKRALEGIWRRPSSPLVKEGAVAKGPWLFDTGASISGSPDLSDFEWSVELPPNVKGVKTAGGDVIRPLRVGRIRFAMKGPDGVARVTLHGALYIPSLALKIFSGVQWFNGGGRLNGECLVLPNKKRVYDLEYAKYGFTMTPMGEPRSPETAHRVARLRDLGSAGIMAIPEPKEAIIPILPESAGEALPEAPDPVEEVAPAEKDRILTHLWHRRLAHAGRDALRKTLAECKDLGGERPQTITEIVCEHCDMTKSLCHRSRKAFPRAQEALEVLHMDSVTIKPAAYDGTTIATYIIDDASRFRWLVKGRGAGDVGQKITSYLEQILKHANRTASAVKTIHTDNGPEFQAIKGWCRMNSVTWRSSAPYEPNENPIAERTVGMVTTKAAAMMHEARFPLALQPLALHEALAIINRTATKALPPAPGRYTTPWQAFFASTRPEMSHLLALNLRPYRSFGCRVFMNVTHHQAGGIERPKGQKMLPRAVEGQYAGYQEDSRNYHVWVPEKGLVYRSPHVIFYEDPVPGLPPLRSVPPGVADTRSAQGVVKTKPRPGMVPPVGDAVSDAPTLRDQVRVDPCPTAAPCGGVGPVQATVDDEDWTMAWTEPEEGKPSVLADENFLADVEIHMTATERDPKTVKEALEGDHAKDWRRAMEAEIEVLLRRGVFEFVDRRQGRPALSAKWVFKEKRDAMNKVIKRKARLVARGFSQRPGIDYEETYASMAAATSARLLFAEAANRGWYRRCMDVVSAYLAGVPLKETLFMEQFPGLREFFESRPKEIKEHGWSSSRIVRLVRPLYGLKQAGRLWQERLRGEMRASGLVPLHADDAVYRAGIAPDARVPGRPPTPEEVEKAQQRAARVMVLTHVDDLMFLGERRSVDEAIRRLGERLEIGEGNPNYYLGMRIGDPRPGVLTLDQRGHIELILGPEPLRAVGVPVAPEDAHLAELYPDEGTVTTRAIADLQKLIGQINFPATKTRPDLAVAVGTWGQRLADATPECAQAAQRLRKYLSGTRDWGLEFQRPGLALARPWLQKESEPDPDPDPPGYEMFVDAAFERMRDGKSVTGWILRAYGGPVAWKSKKQGPTAQSSMEAEFYALVDVAKDAVWVEELLWELGYPLPGPIILREDNSAAELRAKGQLSLAHMKTKHIRRWYSFPREKMEEGVISLRWVPSGENLADFLTKPLARPILRPLLEAAGLRPVMVARGPVEGVAAGAAAGEEVAGAAGVCRSARPGAMEGVAASQTPPDVSAGGVAWQSF